LEKFPLPSISLLRRIEQGGIDSFKSLKLLRERGKISEDSILMIDEMYIQKAAQYQAGEYIGADEEDNLYKGIVVFMVVGLQQSLPFVVQALPEVTFNGEWLAAQIDKAIENLSEAGFIVRGVVTDNHSANVRAFSKLIEQLNSDSELHILHPKNHGKRTYLFFDSVHLMKNIRNNLLNKKKFVFPQFSYNNDLGINVACPAGYITWADLHNIYDADKVLKGNLRKAPKLTYKSLHPGNNKQNVPLALALLEESTLSAMKSYFPGRKDAATLLSVFNKWWTMQIPNNVFLRILLVMLLYLEIKKLNFTDHWQTGLKNGANHLPLLSVHKPPLHY
jgi:hypothetical protein